MSRAEYIRQTRKNVCIENKTYDELLNELIKPLVIDIKLD